MKVLADADMKMKQIVSDLAVGNSQYEEFFRKSYLVITYRHRQFEFKKDLTAIDMARRIGLIKDCHLKDELLELFNLLGDAEKEKKAASFNLKPEINKKIEGLMSKLLSIPLNKLDIEDDFNIEVRFPGVNIEAIQSMKNHYLVNKEKTCTCRTCIGVFLY